MDSLPDWAVSTIAIAVGVSPGLALLMARPIGRFLRRTLLERPEIAPQSRGQRAANLRKLGDRHPAPLPRPTLGDPVASRQQGSRLAKRQPVSGGLLGGW
jgi:hypothetical protein